MATEKNTNDMNDELLNNIDDELNFDDIPSVDFDEELLEESQTLSSTTDIEDFDTDFTSDLPEISDTMVDDFPTDDSFLDPPNDELLEDSTSLGVEEDQVSLSHDELDSILDDVDENDILSFDTELSLPDEELEMEQESLEDSGIELPGDENELELEEPVSLSTEELDNIISDVDESEILDFDTDLNIEEPVTTDDLELDDLDSLPDAPGVDELPEIESLIDFDEPVEDTETMNSSEESDEISLSTDEMDSILGDVDENSSPDFEIENSEIPSYDDLSETDSIELEDSELPELPELDDVISMEESIDVVEATEDMEEEFSADLDSVQLPVLDSIPGLDEDSDDDTVSLSEDELSNIMEDVDETNADEFQESLALESEDGSSEELAPSEDDDDTITLSTDEMDSLIDDVNESLEADFSTDLDEFEPENSEEISDDDIVSVDADQLDDIVADVNVERSSSLDDSLAFEAEIMKDAAVSLAKPGFTKIDEPIQIENENEADVVTDELFDENQTYVDEAEESEQTSDEDAPELREEQLLDEAESLADEIDQSVLSDIDELTEIDEISDLQTAYQGNLDESASSNDYAEAFDGTITADDIRNAIVCSDEVKTVNLVRGKSNVNDKELSVLFKYLDELLEFLPERKIKEFAESQHYDQYIAIINRLGL